MHDHLAHRVHEVAVALDFLGFGEVLREDEVQVAFQGVAVDDGFGVAKALEQALQFQCGLGQALDGKGHVLDDDGGAGGAHGADGRKDALAHVPQGGGLGRVAGEVKRLRQFETSQHVADGTHLEGQRGGGLGAGFDQQRRAVGGQVQQGRRHAGLVLHGAQRCAVQQFHRHHRCGLELGHGLACRLQVAEQHQRTGLVGMLGHSVVADFADEAQRAFGADHQVREDLDRVFEIQQRVQAVSGGVLEPVLVADALGQQRVVPGSAGQRGQPLQQRCVAARKLRAAVGIPAVQYRAVGQHEAHAGQCPVAVLRRAAAHAAGVVGGDAADHGRVDAGRIGTDLAAHGGQAPVRGRADDTGLQMNDAGIGGHAHALPAVAQQDENRIAERLAGQAGAGGAEGQRCLQFGAQGEQALHLGLILDHHHQLRHQPVKARVTAPGQAAQGVGDQPLRRNEPAQALEKLLMRGSGHTGSGSGASPWARPM